MTHTAALWSRGGVGVLSAAATLRKMCANILDSPGVLKYRRVRCAKLDGLLDEGLLRHCGFSRLEYPDGLYWVMHSVDVVLLRAVLRELDLGIATACRHRERAGATAADAAEHPATNPAAEVRASAAAEVRAATSPLPASEPALVMHDVPSLECQLRARNAAHKLINSPAMTPGHRTVHHIHQLRHWILAATMLIFVSAAVGVAALRASS